MFPSVIFTHAKNRSKYSFFISNNFIFLLNSSVCNLGVILTPTLNYNLHIDNSCYKAFKTLGFIKQVEHDLKLLTPLKTL